MAHAFTLPYLPGRFVIDRGTFADYHALSRFHYRRGKPATVAGVWRIRHFRDECSKSEQLAAVGVLSWPVPCVKGRDIAFALTGRRYGEKLAFANQQLRTISRVIVHPVFRATGLATRLVRVMIAECPTPHIEALATMGWAHPFFERAGMTRIEPDDAGEAIYYHAHAGAERSAAPA
jgi:GNAT superfamily N-acetyltransferase